MTYLRQMSLFCWGKGNVIRKVVTWCLAVGLALVTGSCNPSSYTKTIAGYMNFELLCSICPNDHISTWKKAVDKTPGKNWRYDKHLESSPLDLGGIMYLYGSVNQKQWRYVTLNQSWITTKSSLYQFSISYLFETNFMLNKNTRCLKLIFLCQCVQYGPTTSNTSEPTLSHPNVSREFFTRPFSSVLHSTWHFA